MRRAQRIPFKPAAVIFDMDGVIVDSMPYHFIAWYEALRPWGIRLSCFEVYAKEGEKWDVSVRDWLRRARITPTKKLMGEIFALRNRVFKRYYQRFFFGGIEEFISCLRRRKHPLALVTGTGMKDLRKILPARIRRSFDAIVTGDAVRRGKPHPEPYLKAACMLGLDPAGCVVIENAPYGIEAAKKAGMFCIALTTSLPKEYLSRADIILDGLEEVNELIDRSCRI